jgi:16S rRNA (uracil1498-N3)-methyltransferase
VAPRIHCPEALKAHTALALPAAAAKHVQVLRLQPGHTLRLFDGRGGEYQATVTRMHKQGVDVQVGAHLAIELEQPVAIHLALGMPANERMDWLVEKATELGVTSISPLMTARTVVRLQGDRAAKKVAHWQAIAVAACAQCGRNRVPTIHPIQSLKDWLQQDTHPPTRVVLGFAEHAPTLGPSQQATCVLSGPEGGLSGEEEAWALAQGFELRSLGPRVLRAETAALTALTWATYPGGFTA